METLNRNSLSKKIAEELCSVQPMPSDVFKKLYEHGMTEERLIKEGYEPVSRLGLMWIKKGK
jgi:hypothetical protein